MMYMPRDMDIVYVYTCMEGGGERERSKRTNLSKVRGWDDKFHPYTHTHISICMYLSRKSKRYTYI